MRIYDKIVHHIPGKPLLRPKSSRFNMTQKRRIQIAAKLQLKNDPASQFLAIQIFNACAAHSGQRPGKNQRQRRKAMRQRYCHGFHPSFN